MKHVVMFSSGAGSWAAARRVADMWGNENIYLVFSDVKGDSVSPHVGEDDDNYRFLTEAAKDIGGELVWLKDGRTIWQVFKDNRFLGNSRLANCSKFLKQEPARRWLEEHCDPADTRVYVGIDWSEEHRLRDIKHNYLPFQVSAPMCEPPYVDKDDVLAALRARGIDPPRLYELGFAHANCGGGCVRAGQGQFLHLLNVMPERYAEWERNEQEVRDYLEADVSILRDRRGGTLKPLTLRDFRLRVEAKSPDVDPLDIGGCGCFVEEPTLADELMLVLRGVLRL